MEISSTIGDREQVRGQWLTPGLVVRVTVSVGLLAATFWLTSDKLDWRQLQNLDAVTLCICAVLSVAVIWLLAWRWRRVTGAVVRDGSRVPGIGSFAGQTWLGLAANQVLPSILVGDALRVGLLSRQGVALGSAVGSVFLDRVYGMVGLAVLAGITAFLLAPTFAVPSLVVAALVILGAAALALGWRLLGWRLRSIIPARGVPLRLSLVLVGAAMVAHLANIGIFLVVANALGAGLPVLPTVAVMCTVLLVGVLPISIAGWGVREMALVQVLGHIGAGADTIMLSSVTYGLVLFLLQAPGFLLLVRGDRP